MRYKAIPCENILDRKYSLVSGPQALENVLKRPVGIGVAVPRAKQQQSIPPKKKFKRGS